MVVRTVDKLYVERSLCVSTYGRFISSRVTTVPPSLLPVISFVTFPTSIPSVVGDVLVDRRRFSWRRRQPPSVVLRPSSFVLVLWPSAGELIWLELWFRLPLEFSRCDFGVIGLPFSPFLGDFCIVEVYFVGFFFHSEQVWFRCSISDLRWKVVAFSCYWFYGDLVGFLFQ